MEVGGTIEWRWVRLNERLNPREGQDTVADTDVMINGYTVLTSCSFAGLGQGTAIHQWCQPRPILEHWSPEDIVCTCTDPQEGH